jgi:hypothetical protein
MYTFSTLAIPIPILQIETVKFVEQLQNWNGKVVIPHNR